jgi:hypothetical protein
MAGTRTSALSRMPFAVWNDCRGASVGIAMPSPLRTIDDRGEPTDADQNAAPGRRASSECASESNVRALGSRA